MHIFIDSFHQGGKYYAQIASHQLELRKERKFTDQKSLSISSLQTGYLNLENRSVCGIKIERANILYTNVLFVEVPTILQKTILKGSEMKRKNLVRLVIKTEKVWNASLANVLDADMKII